MSRSKAGRDADRRAARRADRNGCASEIGPFAAPDVIQWAPGLPKTRSGKIMRRILRKIAEGDIGNLGDTSTLADPARGGRSGQERGEEDNAVLPLDPVARWASPMAPS